MKFQQILTAAWVFMLTQLPFAFAQTEDGDSKVRALILTGNPAIEKRGFKYFGFQRHSVDLSEVTGATHSILYLRLIKPKQTVELLNVQVFSGHIPRYGRSAPLLISTIAVRCDERATRVVANQSFDAIWNPVGKARELKGTEWGQPLPETSAWQALNAACV